MLSLVESTDLVAHNWFTIGCPIGTLVVFPIGTTGIAECSQRILGENTGRERWLRTLIETAGHQCYDDTTAIQYDGRITAGGSKWSPTGQDYNAIRLVHFGRPLCFSTRTYCSRPLVFSGRARKRTRKRTRKNMIRLFIKLVVGAH